MQDDGRKWDTGRVVIVAGEEMEVTGVSYQEEDGKHTKFSYIMRDRAELQAERKAAADLEAEQERQATEAQKSLETDQAA